jgi:AraC-like DNA-binding protein
VLAGGTVSLIASALGSLLALQRKSGSPAVATFANIRRFIDTHLASPALETDMLAGNFGLSRAALYRLFEPVGGVAAYIRRERLRRVFRDITAPEHANVRLAGLARRWGFKDGSTFNRAFRLSFGISPGAARAAALNGQSVPNLAPSGDAGSLGRWIALVCAGQPRSTPDVPDRARP